MSHVPPLPTIDLFPRIDRIEIMIDDDGGCRLDIRAGERSLFYETCRADEPDRFDDLLNVARRLVAGQNSRKVEAAWLD